MASTATQKSPMMSRDSSGESGDIFGLCLEKLPYDDVVRAKLVSKFFKDYIESNAFNRDRGKARSVEFSLTALHFFFEDGDWHCSGLELASRRWRRLPPLTYLPTQWAGHRGLIAASGGLFCISVSLEHYVQASLIVCNPLTQENVVLPPLRDRRNPVLLHLLPNPATNSFKVMAAGSSSSEMGDLSSSEMGDLSLRTEVFDSLSWKWTETGMIDGPEFCLNEYQTGVCKDGILFCIGFTNSQVKEVFDSIVYKKSLFAYNLEKGEWMMQRLCNMLPIPDDKTVHIVQLVENNQEIFLFLEEITHGGQKPVQWIAKLEISPDPQGNLVVLEWKIIIRRTMGRVPSNGEIPEYTCVPYGVGKLCIFNNIDHTGVVYDVVNQREDEHIFPSPPASHRRLLYHSLNPRSGSFQAGHYARCVPRHAAAQAYSKDINFTLSASQERLSKRLFRQVSCEIRKLHTPHHITEPEGLQICGFLRNDLLKDCLVKLPFYEHLFRMKPVSKPMKQCIESEHFQFFRGEALPNECSLTAVHFMGNESGVWEGSGFDLTLKQWRRLPRLVIPSQAVDSSSQTSHLIAGGGLLCFLSLSNFLGKRSVIVCNPCTQKTRALPPLRLSWKPKLLHLISDSRTMSYQLIVAGYARTGGLSSIHAVIYDYNFHMDHSYE